MRDYGKVHSSFWSSDTISSLSDDGRLLALYLMTCSHNTIAGVFRLPDGYACEDLKWTAERVHEGFAELFRNGFANRCETSKWVWITKHLEWNAPENPNQWKAAKKISAQVPANCSWAAEFAQFFAAASGGKPAEKANPSATLPQPFLNQKQEQEQEVTPLVDGKPSTPPCPHEQIIELYHEHCPTLARVRIWTDARRKALQARWRESPDRQDLGYWERFFQYVDGCPLLRGDVNEWKADLEWLVTAGNFAKVIEGKYENRGAAA